MGGNGCPFVDKPRKRQALIKDLLKTAVQPGIKPDSINKRIIFQQSFSVIN